MIEQYLLSWLVPALWLLASSYAVFTLLLLLFWSKIKTPAHLPGEHTATISVVIPVRNEAANIVLLLQDLVSQTFPNERFQVLVMNDNSTDETAALVEEFARQNRLDIQLINLPDTPTTSPKKRAIETAISNATGSLIVTTDGDCRVEPDWLNAIATCHASINTKLISSPVTFSPANSLTDHLQIVEFSSLIGSGASAIEAGFPSLCNGANLAYEKQAFLDVGGYDGVRHIASGDDEFLMHKIAARFPGSVHFLKDQRAIVSTQPHYRWTDFFRQRKRWASKWKHYQTATPLVLALYVFSCNLSVILAGSFWAFGMLETTSLLGILALKNIPEWLFLGSVLRFLGKPRSIVFIPITQIIYPFYVCFFGLAAQKPTYNWKGRKLV
ncbi:glycosyltransferase [Dyadobacter sp. CY343]|uniref:glycosyltransferase n=1 Tax=Dyadobacter sp. CY343 TaxID=2907299 RepID=UPI001F3296FB|nr:glycosyltransferase [Dyadobacter sp. CY343]MCE7062056.1 glycosyltransferase [Dyadobacter sp. CY343]